MNESTRIPKLKIDLDAPGTFALFAQIADAQTLADQAKIVRRVIETFAERKMTEDELDLVIMSLSVKDVQRIFEAIRAAVEEIKASPL